MLTDPIAIGDLTVRGIKAHHEHLAIVPRRKFQATSKRRTSLRYLGKRQATLEREQGLDRALHAYLDGLDELPTLPEMT